MITFSNSGRSFHFNFFLNLFATTGYFLRSVEKNLSFLHSGLVLCRTTKKVLLEIPPRDFRSLSRALFKSRPIPNQLLLFPPAIFFSFSSFQLRKSSTSPLKLAQSNFPFLDLSLTFAPGNSPDNHVTKLVLNGAP